LGHPRAGDHAARRQALATLSPSPQSPTTLSGRPGGYTYDLRVAYAHFGSRLARQVVEITDHVACLDQGGFWAVVVTFEGKVTCVRFAQVSAVQMANAQGSGPQKSNGQVVDAQPRPPREWAPLTGDWSSSLDETAFLLGVRQIRDRIAAGEVYQVCLCRVMSHPLAHDADLEGLETLIALGNPAPYAGRV